MSTEVKFQKHDTGKLRWSLLPSLPVEEVIRVLEFGAAKYGENNWRKATPDERVRFFDAMQRHIWRWLRGERADPDSGLHPLAHAIASLLFLIELGDD